MLTTVQADAICDESFTSAFAWNRNYKGNLVRRWNGLLLTIFQQGLEFGYCINRGRGKVSFSNRTYRTEAQAMEVLAMHLNEQRATKNSRKKNT